MRRNKEMEIKNINWFIFFFWRYLIWGIELLKLYIFLVFNIGNYILILMWSCMLKWLRFLGIKLFLLDMFVK